MKKYDEVVDYDYDELEDQAEEAKNGGATNK